jgi:ribosomal protein S18 acetylase RimI-like enzyme
MQVALRPAHPQDFDYCARLYFAGMGRIIRELNLDRFAHAAGLREQWDPTQVRIITMDGADVGWLQSAVQGDAVFLAQLFVDDAFQRRGIGTEVMNRLIGEATQARLAVTLGVVKTNPAVRLYDRLGFRITHGDDRKFYMRRETGTQAPPSS